MYLNVCVCDKFLATRNGKKLTFGLFKRNLCELELLQKHFVSKCSFREISMIKMVNSNQNKQILLILKIENSKLRNL